MSIYTIYIYIGFPVSNGFILNYPPWLIICDDPTFKVEGESLTMG